MRKNHKQSRGVGLIGSIITIPAVLIGILILIIGFYEGRKAYWDYKVTRMCEKDGGLRIYEVVTLNTSEYEKYINQFGNFVIPRINNADKNTALVSKDTSIYIRRNSPEVRRNELEVIRITDGKILGTRISYSRVGGDLIAFHPSIYRCPESLDNLFTAVVSKVEEKQL